MAIAETEALAESQDTEGAEPFAGRSPLQIALTRLRHDPVAIICASIIVLLILLGVFAPLINGAFKVSASVGQEYSVSPVDALDFTGEPLPEFKGGTSAHPLGVAPGTANDNLARLLLGIRTSLLIATLATVISTIVGVVIGLIAGFSRGWLDRIISFFTDVFLAFPFLLGALALAPIIADRFGENDSTLARAQFFALVSVLVIFGWMTLARLVRGQVLSLREREFIQAAQVIGAPTSRILFKELLPNLTAPIIIAISLGLPAYVAAEAGLSFLGIGLSGIPSLGQTVNDARLWFETYPLYLWVPVGTIVVLVLALNLLGDSVRDAFDPKTRR